MVYSRRLANELSISLETYLEEVGKENSDVTSNTLGPWVNGLSSSFVHLGGGLPTPFAKGSLLFSRVALSSNFFAPSVGA